jgi:hypothetical protein
MNKLNVKISLKGVLSNCGYKGLSLLKTDRLLNVMSARFGYKMRPENWHTIQLPTPEQLKRRTKDIHPERAIDEFFLGNHDVQNGVELPEHLSGFSTVRLGEKAFDINGVPIARYEMRPMFVHKSEYDQYNRLMSKRLSIH